MSNPGSGRALLANAAKDINYKNVQEKVIIYNLFALNKDILST